MVDHISSIAKQNTRERGSLHKGDSRACKSQTYNKFQQITPPPLHHIYIVIHHDRRGVPETKASPVPTPRSFVVLYRNQGQPSRTFLHESNNPAGVTFLPFPFAPGSA